MKRERIQPMQREAAEVKKDAAIYDERAERSGKTKGGRDAER